MSVFIAYRRDRGAALARLVRDSLAHRGYDVFLDVETLGSGRYDDALRAAIDAARDFVVVLTPGALDGREGEDVFRMELVHALRARRNVVPLFDLGFEWPPGELPPDLAPLRRLHGLTLTHEYFAAAMDQLARMLRSGRRAKRWRLALVSGAAAVFVASLASWWSIQRASEPGVLAAIAADSGDSTRAAVAGGAGRATLSGGTVLFRTERIEPGEAASPGETSSLVRRVDPDSPNVEQAPVAELSFQLSNRSDAAITLVDLRAERLGILAVWEDAPATAMLAEALQLRNAAEERVDLGALEFAFQEAGANDGSGALSIFDPSQIERLEPGAVRSFRLGFRCRHTTQQMTRGLEFAIGGSDLDALDHRAPVLEAVEHTFLVAADVVAASGERASVYSDAIYSVRLGLDPELGVALGCEIERALAAPPTRFAEELLGRGVKTYRETLAYEIATRTRILPSDFDPDLVSPHTYAGDQSSPLRKTARRTIESSGGSELVRSIVAEGRERSNVVEIFRVIRDRHRAIWPPIRTELERLAGVDAIATRRKAEFVLSRLAVDPIH